MSVNTKTKTNKPRKRRYLTRKRRRRRSLLKWLLGLFSLLAVFSIGAKMGYDTKIDHSTVFDTVIEVAHAAEQPVREKTDEEIILELTREAGIEDWKVMALINCESRWNQHAIGVNKDRTIDRGYWQINNYWHDLTNEEAFDVVTSTKYSIELYLKTGDFRLWTCGKKLGI